MSDARSIGSDVHKMCAKRVLVNLGTGNPCVDGREHGKSRMSVEVDKESEAP